MDTYTEQTKQALKISDAANNITGVCTSQRLHPVLGMARNRKQVIEETPSQAWLDHCDELFAELDANRAAPQPKKEYVYLTKADFGYKIGKTTNPDTRPMQVAGNTPIKLEVITVIEVPDCTKAERQLHEHFREKRLRGEWFALTEDDVAFVKGFPASFDSLPDGGDVPF